MTRRFKYLTMTFYGVAVILSGVLSLFAAERGKAGLWFGLVMGALALAAAFLLWLTPRVAGFAIAWLAVGFVGGWFVYDVCARKGPADSEFRMYIVIALSLAVAVILAVPVRKSVTP